MVVVSQGENQSVVGVDWYRKKNGKDLSQDGDNSSNVALWGLYIFKVGILEREKIYVKNKIHDE